jgi:poly(3-hydroxybutyrate) depolymerase
MLEKRERHAAENGHIPAAPEWGNGIGKGHGFSVEGHDAVLDTLRDLRRRSRVDSDRVFLLGTGEGGRMAFDVGLSHPDRFAGVMPMSAGPIVFARRHWRDGQYLPF